MIKHVFLCTLTSTSYRPLRLFQAQVTTPPSRARKMLMHRTLSRDVRFPTMWYVRPAMAQTSLRIGAVWSEPWLVPWIFYECWATAYIMTPLLFCFQLQYSPSWTARMWERSFWGNCCNKARQSFSNVIYVWSRFTLVFKSKQSH